MNTRYHVVLLNDSYKTLVTNFGKTLFPPSSFLFSFKNGKKNRLKFYYYYLNGMKCTFVLTHLKSIFMGKNTVY